MHKKTKIIFIAFSLLLLIIGLVIFQLCYKDISKIYYCLGWIVATINSLLSIKLFLMAQNEDIVKCLFLVFGGGGLRVLAMLVLLIIVMKIFPKILYAFSISMLGCFILYIVFEVVLVFNSSKRIKTV